MTSTSTSNQSVVTNNTPNPIYGTWIKPVEIHRSKLDFKSLANFCCNLAVGCSHACPFCYSPQTSAIKLKSQLSKFGVSNPDAEWGQYALMREWDEKKFNDSLWKAEDTPVSDFTANGHHGILLSSTSDPYMTFRHPDPKVCAEMQKNLTHIRRRALKCILNNSDMKVRILTRGLSVREDFELFKQFGKRLVFGMSLPTLDPNLAKVYEPHSPTPQERLKVLQEAKAAGLHVFTVVAPISPDSDAADIERTLKAIGLLDPITVFSEPITIRAENVTRIEEGARRQGITVNVDCLKSEETWRPNFIAQLQLVENVAISLGMKDRLHLWPDKDLEGKAALAGVANPAACEAWFKQWWTRKSEWPA